jgi:hypothetical protein
VLTWSPPSSGNATSYVLEAGTGAGLTNIISFDTGSTATTLTVTSVPNGTYFVRVRARNADGNGAPSNEVTIVIGAGPGPGGPSCVPAPTGLMAEANGNTLVLRWTSVGEAVAYIIEAGSTSGASNFGSVDTGSTAATFTASVPSGTYYIRLRSRAACGTSGPSNEITVTVTGGPATPTATGRWVGTSPHGMLADPGHLQCPDELDLTMDLTAVGGTISGTATTRIRRVQYSTCSDVFNSVATYGVSGTVGAGNTLSMQFGTGSAAYVLTATFSLTEMTGRWTHQQTGQVGSFRVLKQ